MASSSNNDGDDGMVSGINVTPLVDITLVLLIIFMVTAKLIVSQSMPLDLPKAANGTDIQLVFGVELHQNGDILVDNKKLANDDAIVPLAKEAQSNNPELRAIIRADSSVQHGRVIKVLDLLKTAGVTKIAFGVAPIPAGEPAPSTPPPATSK